MTEEFRFSVVIAAHNAARTLPATIKSVLAQSRQDFEVHVIDDGSVDETEAALRRTTSDIRVHYVRQKNLGPAAARNLGIQRARGQYIAILDSDDLWLPNYLEAIGDAFEARPAAALAYTDAWRFDDETRRIFRRTAMASQAPPPEPPADAASLLYSLLARNFVYTSATIRRSVLDEVGGFRTLTRSEDYELWLRIAAAGHRFVRARGILAVYRDRLGSRNHDPLAMLRGREEIYRMVVDEYEIPPPARAVARSRLHATEQEVAALAGRSKEPDAAGWRLSRTAQFVRDLRDFYRTPPAEVAAAFPDLRTL
jgi:glycosyltransferase involved in cell wall biosynthesis